MTVADFVTGAVGVGIAVLGLLFALIGVQHFLEGRRVAGHEITPIAELEPGPASVFGTARSADDRVLSAPLSGRECLAYEYEVREAQGKNRQTPTVIAEGIDRVPFHVEDDTGEVLVRPEAAELELTDEGKLTVTPDAQPPAAGKRFLAGRDDIGEPADRTIDVPESGIGTRCFRESVLQAGEDAFVFGRATTHQSREFGETDVEIREGAAGGHPNPTTFIVADKPKDAVGGGYQSGGALAFIIGCVGVAIGTAIVLSTPLV